MPDFDMSRFMGRWYIVASTFPMWTRGNRTKPQFHYGPLPGHPDRMSDEVSYTRAGRRRRILGVDTRVKGPDIAFRWRGKGMLRLLTSTWRVTHFDPDYQWAVITFSRSLLTPSGVDVIARQATLPDAFLKDIQQKIGAEMPPRLVA